MNMAFTQEQLDKIMKISFHDHFGHAMNFRNLETLP